MVFQFETPLLRAPIRLFHVSAQPLVFGRILGRTAGPERIQRRKEPGKRPLVSLEKRAMGMAADGSPSLRLGRNGHTGTEKDADDAELFLLRDSWA